MKRVDSIFSKKGFTLTELLVSLVLLGILIAAILAATQTVRKKTQATQCVSNLRVLGGGLLGWSADSNQRLPSRQRRDAAGKRIYNWMEALEKGGYVSSTPRRPANKLFFCPSSAKPEDDSEGYGMRQWGAASGSVKVKEDDELPMTFIRNPSRFFLLADSAKQSGAGFVQWYTIQSGSGNNGAFLVHQGKANAVFADGHVEAVDESYFENYHYQEPDIFRATDGCMVLKPN